MAKKPLGSRAIEDFDIFNSDDNSWRVKAACKGVETSTFFGSPKSNDIKVAKSICSACPVSAHCLKSAITYQYYGVWGNTTEDERSYIIKSLLNYDVSNLTLEQSKKFVSMF